MKDHIRTFLYGLFAVADVALIIYLFTWILSFDNFKQILAISYILVVAGIMIYFIGFVIRLLRGEIT